MKRTVPAPLSVWRTLDLDEFLLGAPRYPEHVDESYWQRDAERMAAAGFNIVRLGEFAWHIVEPREGVFDFSLFDRAIEIPGAYGIKAIFCTPAAMPPRWLTRPIRKCCASTCLPARRLAVTFRSGRMAARSFASAAFRSSSGDRADGLPPAPVGVLGDVSQLIQPARSCRLSTCRA